MLGTVIVEMPRAVFQVVVLRLAFSQSQALAVIVDHDAELDSRASIKQHLRVPVVSRERPAVAEHDGLSTAPVLIIDLHPIFGCNCTHRFTPFYWRVVNLISQ